MAKFIECICAGCVPLVDEQPSLLEMGFVENVHYLRVDKSDDLETATKIVERACSSEGFQIAQNAQKLVLENHTFAHRIKDFVQFLEKLE